MWKGCVLDLQSYFLHALHGIALVKVPDELAAGVVTKKALNVARKVVEQLMENQAEGASGGESA